MNTILTIFNCIFVTFCHKTRLIYKETKVSLYN